MKTIITLFTVCFCIHISAQNEDEMEAWNFYMTPSETHKVLQSFNGTWETTQTMWKDPEAQPLVMKGTVENEMILGDRYQKSTYFSDFQGMPFEGISTLAFDNVKKEFISTWIDNFGTGLTVLYGKWTDDSYSKIELQGTMVDPFTEMEIEVKEIFYIKDDKNQLMEMYYSMDGKEFKSMEIVYKRNEK